MRASSGRMDRSAFHFDFDKIGQYSKLACSRCVLAIKLLVVRGPISLSMKNARNGLQAEHHSNTITLPHHEPPARACFCQSRPEIARLSDHLYLSALKSLHTTPSHSRPVGHFMTSSCSKTLVGQSNDGPNQPLIHTTPSHSPLWTHLWDKIMTILSVEKTCEALAQS